MEKEGRTYKSAKNISYGLAVTVINVLLAFITRTFFVKYLGPDFLGLNGLFTEVITMLSLAELGVGMAINYSLYKPIHDNDIKRINQLMTLFKKTYNVIAAVILVLGLILIPFIHLIVTETDFSHSFIRLVFFLFVIDTASSYLFSYNTSFIYANQKQYIVSLVTTIVKILGSILSIVMLVLFKDYILYVLTLIIQTFAINLSVTIYVKNKYPFINYKDNLEKIDRNRIFADIKNIFIKRLSGVLTSSTTNILISVLVSTVQVGLYSNYIMLFSLVRTLKSQFSNGIKASIGDMSVTEDSNICVMILQRLTYIFFVFALISCAGLLAISSDIISIWLGSEFVLGHLIVDVAIFNLFIELVSEPLWQYLEVSGLFRQDRNIAIVGSSINLAVAITLGYKYGMVGIFLGTVSTQIIQMILKTRILFKEKYKLSSCGYTIMNLKILISFIIILFINIYIIGNIHISVQIVQIAVRGIVAVIVALVLSILLFLNSAELNYVTNNFLSLYRFIKYKK